MKPPEVVTSILTVEDLKTAMQKLKIGDEWRFEEDYARHTLTVYVPRKHVGRVQSVLNRWTAQDLPVTVEEINHETSRA